MSGYAAFFIAIAIAWVLQLYFSYQQAMRFNDTLKPLRQKGRTAVGLGGKKFYRGKAFVAIAHQGDEVVDARMMKGFTIFARPRPFPELIGLSLTRLASDEKLPGMSDKVRSAAQMAASTLLNSTQTEQSVSESGE